MNGHIQGLFQQPVIAQHIARLVPIQQWREARPRSSAQGLVDVIPLTTFCLRRARGTLMALEPVDCDRGVAWLNPSLAARIYGIVMAFSVRHMRNRHV